MRASNNPLPLCVMWWQVTESDFGFHVHSLREAVSELERMGLVTIHKVQHNITCLATALPFSSCSSGSLPHLIARRALASCARSLPPMRDSRTWLSLVCSSFFVHQMCAFVYQGMFSATHLHPPCLDVCYRTLLCPSQHTSISACFVSVCENGRACSGPPACQTRFSFPSFRFFFVLSSVLFVFPGHVPRLAHPLARPRRAVRICLHFSVFI